MSAGLRALVFDLDGTLLHTMPDLAAAANQALDQMGFPRRTQDEMLAHMGRGGRRMIDGILPPEATAGQREEAFERWRALYIGSDYALTAPYDGIVDTLRELRALGMRTAILSNKFDADVQTLARRHFAGLFDAVRGDAPPMPRKPDPTSLLQVLDELGVAPGEAAYVGDTVVDVQVARNAGTMAVGVSWGYARAAPLTAGELDAYVRDPRNLLDLCR